MYTLWGYLTRHARSRKINDAETPEPHRRPGARIGAHVEEDRYCIDIVTQISAVRAALRRAEEEILRDHVSHCVEHAIASGDTREQRKKIAELMDVLGRTQR
jgi:DNA-binding FrmR family transcriptional regulator